MPEHLSFRAVDLSVFPLVTGNSEGQETLLKIEFDGLAAGGLRTVANDDHVAEDPGVEFVSFLDLADFISTESEDEVKVDAGTTLVDFVGELTTTHGNGRFQFATQVFDQLGEFGAKGLAFIIRLADVQNEYCFVFFQDSNPLCY